MLDLVVRTWKSNIYHEWCNAVFIELCCCFLGQMCLELWQRSYDSSETIIKEGDKVTTRYILASGKVYTTVDSN